MLHCWNCHLHFPTRDTEMHENSYLHHVIREFTRSFWRAYKVIPSACFEPVWTSSTHRAGSHFKTVRPSVYVLLQVAYSRFLDYCNLYMQEHVVARVNSWKELVINVKYNYYGWIYLRKILMVLLLVRYCLMIWYFASVYVGSFCYFLKENETH